MERPNSVMLFVPCCVNRQQRLELDTKTTAIFFVDVGFVDVYLDHLDVLSFAKYVATEDSSRLYRLNCEPIIV